MRRVAGIMLLLVLALGAAGPAMGQEAAGEVPTREELMEIIRALEERVRVLEELLQRLIESGAGGEEIAELRRQIDLLTRELERKRLGEAAGSGPLESRFGLGPAASKVYGIEQGVSIGGYGEMLYQNFDAEADDGTASGRTDELDLLRVVFYFGYKFNDRILFNSEIEFEHATTGKDGETSIEFAYLDFLVNPAFNLRGGILLIPAGFINELHEPPIFLGAGRPMVERVILPTTWRENGVGFFGDAGSFSYRAYLMNGFDAEGFSASSGLRGGRQKGSGAKAEDFILTGRLDWSPGKGLVLGGWFYTGDSGQDTVAAGVGTTLWDLHAEWKARGWSLRGVWAEAGVDDTPAIFAVNGEVVGEKMVGWYAEAGYDLLNRRDTGQALIPYIRYEKFNTQDQVASGFLADPANDVELTTYGIAYKPIDQVAIKADFQDFRNAAGTGVDQFNVALTWLF